MRLRAPALLAFIDVASHALVSSVSPRHLTTRGAYDGITIPFGLGFPVSTGFNVDYTNIRPSTKMRAGMSVNITDVYSDYSEDQTISSPIKGAGFLERLI